MTADAELNLYKVAFQRKEGDPIQLYSIKETTPARVHGLLKSVFKFTSYTEFAFIEVHEIMEGGMMRIVYGDFNTPWPKVNVIDNGCIIKGKSEPVVVPAMPGGVHKYDLGSKLASDMASKGVYTEKTHACRPLTMRMA